MLEPGADDRDLAARDPARHEQRAGLDAVADELAVDGHEVVDADDLDGRRARADHLRAHAVQHRRELDDLRLTRRVLDHGGALGEHRGRQQVLGGAVAREVEDDARPGELLRARLDEAVDDVDLDAHRGEAAEVHVERTAADVVAAGHRDARLAEPTDERAEHVHRRAHQGDELVRRLRPERAGGVDLQFVRTRPLDTRAHAAQHVDHHVEVVDGVDVADRGDTRREQRGRHLLQARVLGAARHADRTRQGRARGDHERIGHLRHRTPASPGSLGEAEGNVVEVEDPAHAVHRDRLSRCPE